MPEETLDGLGDRLKAADRVLHQSSLHITYFFWVDEQTIDSEICEALNYALISNAFPDRGVWCWAALPKFSEEQSEVKEDIVNSEIEVASMLCTGEAVAEHARLLLLLAREATDMRMQMLGTMGGSAEQRARGAALAEEYRGNARRITDQIVNHFRAYVSNLLVAGDRRESIASFPNLKQAHDTLKPLWKEAKKLATEARRSKIRQDGWRDEVRAFFARHGFAQVDDDLIARLDDPDTWPEDLCAALERHGAEGKPYDIGLEHAARFCGFPGYADYALTLRQLKQKLKNGYARKNG